MAIDLKTQRWSDWASIFAETIRAFLKYPHNPTALYDLKVNLALYDDQSAAILKRGGGLSAMSTPRQQFTKRWAVNSEAEGVAAPLEPSARDKDIEQLERERERVGQEFGHVRWTEAEKQPDGSYKAGVAAPLEPLTVPQICIDCGHEFGVWFAENPVWNAIIPSRVGMLCPCCFIVRADKHGFRTTGWKMVPMDNPLGEESVEQEPTPTLEQWMRQTYENADLDRLEIPARIAMQIAESYAAAVSKNLQQQNAHLIKEGLRVDADADKWMNRAAKAEQKVEELEKEITALRETDD